MCPTTHVARGPLGVMGEGTRLPSLQPFIPLRPQEGPPPLLPGGPLPPFLGWAQVTPGCLVAFGCLCKPGRRPRLRSEATGPWAASPFFLLPVWGWGIVPTSAGDPLGTPALQDQQHPGWSETWSQAPCQTDQSQTRVRPRIPSPPVTHTLERVKPWAPGVLGKGEKTDYTQSPEQRDTWAPSGMLLEAQAGSRL